MATISSSLPSCLLQLLCLLLAAAANHQPQEQSPPASPPFTLPGCPDKCGNVSIPFPFGTKEGCFRPGFFVVCNHTFDPPRPFINSSLELDDFWKTRIVVEDLYYLTSEDGTPTQETEPSVSVWPIELADVSLSEGKARLLSAFSYDIRLNETHRKVRRQGISFDFSSSPFQLSAHDNTLIGIGKTAVADILVAEEMHMGMSCLSYSDDPATLVNGSCTGQGCCQTYLPHNVDVDVGFSKVIVNSSSKFYPDVGPCSYAMIVEKTWYNFSTVDLEGDAFLWRNAAGVVPLIIDFKIDLGGCSEASEATPKDFACISDNSKCVDRKVEDSTAYYCRCSVGYEGNPYIQGGCQDIDECARPRDMYPCHGKCKNTPGDYECSCPAGKRGNAKEGPCNDLFPLPAKISIGVVAGLFIIALLVFITLIHNEKRKMAEFFKKNGGPTLEKAKYIKIYKKEELDPILKQSNFIGRGAFGEVYKGFLDNQFVAVKKPTAETKETHGNDMENGQFANEVIIQSQVIHRNIVKLIGCCLEVDKPMLVYEFLSKGSLDEILHGRNYTQICLECRLNIATESAEGLAYLHSKASVTEIIKHGDVKPSNILLDDCFTPKISDFGISRLIVTDKQLTNYIICDRSYVDPIYFQTGLLTAKSDVYSFGIVLLELISREKATCDENSIVRKFLDAYQNQEEAVKLFDKEIAKPEALKLLNSLHEIAVNCLDLDLNKRPDMAEVAESLLMLKRSWNNTLIGNV